MQFKKFIYLDIKRLLNKRYITPILLIMLLATCFIQFGLNRYQKILQEKKHFLNLENKKLERIVHIQQYGFYGIQILFIPSPMIALYNAGPSPDLMTTFLDSSERLKVYQSLQGQNAFIRLTGQFSNFSGFILLCGSILSMLYGYTATKNHEWLIFLESFSHNRKTLFLFFTISRVISLLLICLLLIILSILIFCINGVCVNLGQIFVYSLMIIQILLFFQIIGMLTGIQKNQYVGWTVAVILWFSISFFIPMFIWQLTYNRAMEINSTQKIEAEKQKLFMEYERGAYIKSGKFNQEKRGADLEREMFLDFWNGGFKKSIEYDQKLIDQVKNQGLFFQTIASLFPSTFFLSFCNEMSSCGFFSLVDFQNYSLQMKKDFIWFFAKTFILSSQKNFHPFIKGEENLFYGKSRLPENFLFGLTMNLLWLLGLFTLLWKYFNRLLNFKLEAQGEIPENEKIELSIKTLKKGTSILALTSQPCHLYRFLRRLNAHSIPFLLVPHPNHVPNDLKIKDLFSFFGLALPETAKPLANTYGHHLTREQKAQLVLDIAGTIRVETIVFNNFHAGLSDYLLNQLKIFVETHKRQRQIVYFSSTITISKICGAVFNYPDGIPRL